MTYDFKPLLDVPKATRESNALRKEQESAAWEQFGRTVSKRMMSAQFVDALNRAGIKAKSVREMRNMLMVYLQTGGMP